ncbi:MAG: ribosome maturation factor RimP [Clostridium sp.]|uniref:ribosome maturation factor RimP n=1 Tax=Clostridium culturomicium TaxID=1499683 RepID=UPI00058DC8EF|nr:ribosome maturation factor RimP [Clostridium culturomicium]MDU4889038.1 ribosome maturation factor RimP [Clostridium sp.]MDU7083318.1 ribosome maturation factor RimP [Clostridium sp.]
MSNVVEKLNDKIGKIVEKQGFDLYHLEYVREGGQNILRVYIDKDTGVALNDCVSVSRLVSEMLDVEDPIAEEYTLEVSSPGVFRTLFTKEHFERYMNTEVAVKLSALVEGKKKLEGVLKGFDGENLTLEVENNKVEVPMSKVSVVTLNPTL